ncbi:MAG TPA: alkaline phosphatase family protein [Thermoleophilaceae bacterium]|nr:alkaline phosphatase family protein [Thermoleophilaceae bacterium]
MRAAARAPKKLVLAVIDALSPEALDRAIDDDRAPVLGELVRRGDYARDCISTFPSLTPVAASAITTGLGPDDHLIPSMNWYHRGEERYVEYGSSFPATRAFGVFRSLQDTVYNMNLAHLTQDHRTIFEQLDDAGLRTACTTYLIYRGRFRHDPAGESRYRRLAEAAQFRHAVWGPRELFYADLFDSRRTGCSSTLGMPGQRDRHAGCVGAQLVEHDLFDFLLLSLPDNDTHSHRAGPDAQPTSIAAADRALEQVFHAAGGVDEFLADHAVIVMSDHSQSRVEQPVNLSRHLGDWRVLEPSDSAPEEAELAVCPGARSAMVYVLDEAHRERMLPRLVRQLRGIEGVDLTAWREARPDGHGDEAVVVALGGELRFAAADPSGAGERSPRRRPVRDQRGASWELDGDLDVLDLAVDGGELAFGDYPDALGRLWSALHCPRGGDVLLSATPGYEFVDWGGSHHRDGGSHGSLHRCDSLGVLLTCGVDGLEPDRGQPHLRDVTPMIAGHFGLIS